MSYWKVKKATEEYKKAVGKEAKPVPQEIVELEKEIKEAERELKRAKSRGAPEPVIQRRTSALGSLRYRLRQLLIARESEE